MSNTPPLEDSCPCELCTQHRLVQAIKMNGSPEELRALIDELEEHLLYADADNEYYRAIMDGSWPSARKIAQRIIERCDRAEALAIPCLKD